MTKRIQDRVWFPFVLLVVMFFGAMLGAIHLMDALLLLDCSEQAAVVEPVRREALPEICSPFYNDGTGRWAECMGVGPK